MPDARLAPEVVGRDAELAEVARWIDRLGDGPAGLAIVGEPGIGKSIIWQGAIEVAQAAGARVLVSRPVEAELPYGYAALGDLLHEAVLPVLDELPGPQADGLAAALSLASAPAPGDPLLVGRAVATAFGLLAARGPIVLAIDDAQWLDRPSARAFAFAARRVGGLRIGWAVTLREGHPDPLDLQAALGPRSSRLRLTGLSLGAIGRLLRSSVDPELPRHAVLRIHERAAGNPMFAIQLARSGADGLPASLDDLVARRLQEAPPEARAAVDLIAVLGPAPVQAFRDGESLDAAVAAGVLVEEGGAVRFSHPLLAAAAYQRIPPGRRRALHRSAAAEAQSPEVRAQHLALATDGPDEGAAQVVEDAARAARARGAVETAVALAAHARRLTPTDGPAGTDALARRTMDHADYLYLAADERGARAVVDELLEMPVRGAARVRALVHRALTETEAPPAVAALEEASRVEHGDRTLAARTLAQLAWQRGAWLGDVEPALEEARRAVALAEDLGDDPTLITALTTLGLISSLAIQPGAADHYRRALEILARAPTAAGDHTPRTAFANERWWRGDFATAAPLLADERALATEQGDEGLLMRRDVFGAEFALRQGRWDDAERLLEDALGEARDYWRSTALIRRAILRARRGDPRAADDVTELRAASRDPFVRAAGDFAAGLMAASEGRTAEAADLVLGLLQLSDSSGSRGPEFAVLVPEAIAILVMAGRIGEARAITANLERRSVQLEPWSDAAVALCRGLIEIGDEDGSPADAERLLASAVAGFEAIGTPWELAQALLATGTLLRRMGQRRRAGDVLERAVSLFQSIRAEPARRRAIEELGRARPRPRSDDRLTAAEARVAALVAQGMSNRDVAAQLFTTVATVEAHLTRVYAKLGIRSRTVLARRVSDGQVTLDQ